MMTASSYILGFYIAGMMHPKVGPKLMLVCSNGLSTAGGAALLLSTYGLDY